MYLNFGVSRDRSALLRYAHDRFLKRLIVVLLAFGGDKEIMRVRELYRLFFAFFLKYLARQNCFANGKVGVVSPEDL